jgi:hypothetical protein
MEQIMSNMDDFNKATAMILEKCFAAFPQRISVKVRDLDPTAEDNTLRNFGDTIIFLAKEGFIRYESSVLSESFDGVALSSKGLSILNSMPDVLNDKQSLGQKLGGALKSGSKDVLKSLVNQIISAAVKGYIQAGGG